MSFKLKIGLDVDEIVYECVSYALNLTNKKYNKNLKEEDVLNWGLTNTDTDLMFEFMEEKSFYETQPVINGAKEFVHKLCKIADVYFVTAIAPEFMGERIQRLLNDFPEVKKENIIMTSSKNVIDLDILFDDGGHNILKSIAKYPILLRKPWNSHITGTLAVNNYDEFFTIYKEICKGYKEFESFPNIIALVGPSGSGKDSLSNKFIENGFVRPITYTTKESNNLYYKKVKKKEFEEYKKSKFFFETTAYAGHNYGTSEKEILSLLKEGKRIIIPVDVCGAMAFKNRFKDVMTIFVKEDKKEIIRHILEDTDLNTDETITRILSLDMENKNKEICDLICSPSNSYEEVLEQIKELII